MSFDWFTLIAQLVNFALLLLLLRVFLYRPVLNLMEQRQTQLTQAWDAARDAEAQARDEAAQLAAARAELESERRKRLEQVEQEAAALRRRRQQQTEAEGVTERQRQAARLRKEREVLVGSLIKKSAAVLVGELETTLQELADQRLEDQAARLFVSRLEALPAHQLEQLRGSAATPVITTAFEPSTAAAELLTQAVRQVTGTHTAPKFERDPGLIFGAALTVGPVRVEASGRRRMAALGAAFEAALDTPVAEVPSGARLGQTDEPAAEASGDE